jgi:hypothetical protein
LPLPQPNAGTAAVLVDELDTCSFKGTSDDLERRASRIVTAPLELSDCHDTDPRSRG